MRRTFGPTFLYRDESRQLNPTTKRSTGPFAHLRLTEVKPAPMLFA